MDFGIPPRNEEVTGVGLKQLPPPLRAMGNLGYVRFIALVRHLWEEAHPDISIRPVQSSKYSKYPCIVYGLEMRRPVQNESKPKLRETIYQAEDGKNYLVKAQRFQNLITFTVITENNPELCEAIIEAFEDFMMEFTPIYKKLGVSEILYSRRLPDREQTRPDEDIEERSVAYLVTLEKVVTKEVPVLESIYIKARTMIDNYWQGSEFWIYQEMLDDSDEGFTDELYAPGHEFKAGDLIEVTLAGDNQDHFANGLTETYIDNLLPDMLWQQYTYQIYSVTENSLKIKRIDGVDIKLRTIGMGRITGTARLLYPQATQIEIQDDQTTFTGDDDDFGDESFGAGAFGD